MISLGKSMHTKGCFKYDYVCEFAQSKLDLEDQFALRDEP